MSNKNRSNRLVMVSRLENRKQLRHDDYSVGWICGTLSSLTFARSLLDEQHQYLETSSWNPDLYNLGSMGGKNVVLTLHLSGLADTSISLTIKNLIRAFPSVKDFLFVGIGGGIPSKVSLGDVVVGEYPRNTSGIVRYVHEDRGPGKIRDVLVTPSDRLFSACHTLMSLHASDISLQVNTYLSEFKSVRPALYKQFKWPKVSEFSELESTSFLEKTIGQAEKERRGGLLDIEKSKIKTKIHAGLIVLSSMAIEDSYLRDRIDKDLDRRVFCFDMDGGVITEDVSVLFIRGIRDYSDEHKNEDWEGYAAFAASVVAKELVKLLQQPEQSLLTTKPSQTALPTQFRDSVPYHITSESRDLITKENILDFLGPNDRAEDSLNQVDLYDYKTIDSTIEKENFQTWLKPSSATEVLFCHGFPTVGKEMILKALLNSVSKSLPQYRPENFKILYCKNRTYQELLSVLVRKLWQNATDLTRELEQLCKNHRMFDTKPSLQELSMFLKATARTYSPCIIVIDAIDNVSRGTTEDLQEFLDTLCSFQLLNNAKMIVTSRSIITPVLGEALYESFATVLNISFPFQDQIGSGLKKYTSKNIQEPEVSDSSSGSYTSTVMDLFFPAQLPKELSHTSYDMSRQTGRHRQDFKELELRLEGNSGSGDDAQMDYSDDSNLLPLMSCYISEIADALIEEIRRFQPDEQDFGRISDVLSRLLQAFSLKIGYAAPKQIHRDVMVFIHRNREEIVKRFQERLMMEKEQPDVEDAYSEGPASDFEKMPLDDLMDHWDQRLEAPESHCSEHSSPPADLLSLKELPDLPGIDAAAYKNFMFGVPEYAWLLGNFQKELSLVPTEPKTVEVIRDKIMDTLPSSRKVSRQIPSDAFKTKFVIRLDLRHCIQRQGYKENPGEAIEKAITITGSVTDAQALSCLQYMKQTWPLTGEYTMQVIKRLIQEKDGKMQICRFPYRTKLTARMYSSKLIVVASGTKDFIADIGEQLAWLGSALSISHPDFGAAYSIPTINRIELNDLRKSKVSGSLKARAICELSFAIKKKEEQVSNMNGQCWHHMFRNLVIVQGYPIPRRSKLLMIYNGLEIPLNMMTGLARTKYVDLFDQSVFIKGFSTLLVPMIRLRDTIVWHLIYREDGDRISYADGASFGPENLSISEVEGSRHILGWSSNIKYFAGAADAKYNIKSSGLPRPFPTCVLGGARIHRGQIVGGGHPFVIGYRETPVYVSRKETEKLSWIHKKSIIFWDEEDKRGWLVNGTSALLHLLRRSLKYDSEEFEFRFCFNWDLMKEARITHKPKSAIEVLWNDHNMGLDIFPEKDGFYRLEDRLEGIYRVLEKIIDFQDYMMGHMGSEPTRKPKRMHLEGWDFNDLATNTDPIYPRVATIQPAGKGWTDFAHDIHAVTLFGRKFGEIFQPVNRDSSCLWATLPVKKYYLAISSDDLRKISDNMAGDIEEMKVTNDIIWYSPQANVEKCHCEDGTKAEHSDLVQVLMPSKFHEKLQQPFPLELETGGSIIFGHNEAFRWFWNDTGDPVEGDLPLQNTPVVSVDQDKDSALGSSMISLAADDYTIGIVCALTKELKAVLALFDHDHNDFQIPSTERPLSPDTNHYALGRIGRHNVVATCLPFHDIGTNAAATVHTNMRWSFQRLRICLLIGIGGGIPSKKNDVRLGDVVVGLPEGIYSGVVQHDRGKILTDDVLELAGSLHPPPDLIRTAINLLEARPGSRAEQIQHHVAEIVKKCPEYKSPALELDKLFKNDSLHIPGKGNCLGCKNPSDRPSGRDLKVHYGLIASDNQVIKDAKKRDELSKKYNALCVEMEAAGMTRQSGCLVIRGICDYADSHKNDTWHEYAAATAAAYAKLLLTTLKS